MLGPSVEGGNATHRKAGLEMSVCDPEGFREPGEIGEGVAPPAERRSLLTSRVSWRSALAVILAIVVLRLWVVESVIVDGSSMSRTLLSEEWVLVLKPLRPHRFSVVVFTDPQEKTTAIKRVVGMPGDGVERLPDPGQGRVRPRRPIVVNGTSYDEPYAWYTGHGIIRAVTVPDDCYYVLGDNRGDSVDSRAYGPIPRDSVRGVAVAVVYPFSRMRTIVSEAEPVAVE
jgi:signal peptidase I